MKIVLGALTLSLLVFLAAVQERGVVKTSQCSANYNRGQVIELVSGTKVTVIQAMCVGVYVRFSSGLTDTVRHFEISTPPLIPVDEQGK